MCCWCEFRFFSGFSLVWVVVFGNRVVSVLIFGLMKGRVVVLGVLVLIWLVSLEVF